MPNQHALLSPSSSERWLHCPRSVRLCEGMADTTSSYASEGTEAHALCEHLLLQALGRNTTDPRPQFKQYSNEMQEAAEGYVQYVMEQVADFRAQGIEPAVYVEQRLDLRAFIPDCMSKDYTRKQRKRDDKIILFIYGLIIVAFLSVIFSAWWLVFRTTRYYSVPFPSETAPYKCFVLDRFIQQTAQESGISTAISLCEIQS